MRLSENFTLEEYIRSDTARRCNIDNTPNTLVVENIRQLNSKLMQPIRTKWGKPIVITSGYRCEKLNKKVKGSKTSYHLYGQAADFRASSGTREENKKLWDMVMAMNLDFDECVWEYGTHKEGPDWIHIAYSPRKRKQIKFIGVK